MDDEIKSAAELIDRAELRDIAIVRALADRSAADLAAAESAPEELHAPGCPDEFAAIELSTRLTDTELVVRLDAETCNAYAGFQVSAEALFALPAPVALGKEPSVHEFTEKVGWTTVFPYIRAAVGALATQVSVPASPLPLLPTGGVELLDEEAPSAPTVPDGVLAAGTFTRTSDDGTEEQFGEFFIDAETGNFIRFGAEGLDPDLEALLETMAESAAGGWTPIATADEETWQGLIREHGLDEARAIAESIRESEGDEAADGALERIETAAWNVALADAVIALNDAMNKLGEAVSAAGADDAASATAASGHTGLRDAAAEAITRWNQYRDL